MAALAPWLVDEILQKIPQNPRSMWNKMQLKIMKMYDKICLKVRSLEVSNWACYLRGW
jgi:hypothetical protein